VRRNDGQRAVADGQVLPRAAAPRLAVASWTDDVSGEGAAGATRLLARALHFAARQHVRQRRKGADGEPYINHLAEVADLIAEATEGLDVNLVVAALLHDVVEDTDTTSAEVAAAFGEDVAALVAEVTDDKTLPKAERKRLQIVHAPSLGPRAKLLKLADKTSNLRALAASPPANWSPERRRDYIAWGRAVVAGMRGACPWLEERFDAAAAAAEAAAGE
jgi:(p)ppGpp synthase/HD superfamily hydrolase